jgi:predicted peptidase
MPQAGSGKPGSWNASNTVNGMQYMVMTPGNYDSSLQYPVVLYLHQSEMGSGGPSLLQSEINEWFDGAFETAYPCIVVAPLVADQDSNGDNFGGFSSSNTPAETNSLAALQQVIAQYSVDTTRLYLTGNSMGGYGTWDLMIKYNAYNGTQGQLFAAGMPLAGSDSGQSQSTVAAQLISGKVPIWSIHGAQDTTVSPAWDEYMGANATADPNFAYTEVASDGHDVWDDHYPLPGGKTYWDWLFGWTSAGGKPSLISGTTK